MAQKAAIVIGVGQVGVLTPLKSAARCARQVADWLAGEDYDVECLTDEAAPVTTALVDAAIERFVTAPPRYHQLLVYFTGHGYWQARADIWLLSKAANKTSEAINLDGAMDLARYSGIPNVIFISDACRSLPDARSAALVRGVDAFPLFDDIDQQSKVDVFRATSDAQAAYEATVDGEPTSMLTLALRSAFREPTQDMVLEVDGRQVVPNRRLEAFLQAKIDDTLAVIDSNLAQRIEANVPSGDSVYIAQVRQHQGAAAPAAAGAVPAVPPAAAEATPGPVPAGAAGADGGAAADLAQPAAAEPVPRMQAPPQPTVARDMAGLVPQLLAKAVNLAKPIGNKPTFDAKETLERLDRLKPFLAIDHFESQCGFTVSGAPISNVITTGKAAGTHAELLDQGWGWGNDAPGVVRLWEVKPAATVLLQLDDGRVAVLAALAGYIGHVTIGSRGVRNVSYVPSSNNWRHAMYQGRRESVDQLRAMAALAADENVFRVDSDKEAANLADQIRIEKSMDPTLGLYAAHAYTQAGKPERVLEVAQYMNADLYAELFDVQVLNSRPGHKQVLGPPVPFCPLLTQTWNLLRPRGFELPQVLVDASAYLRNSLWTTFEAEAWEPLREAIEKGELQ